MTEKKTKKKPPPAAADDAAAKPKTDAQIKQAAADDTTADGLRGTLRTFALAAHEVEMATLWGAHEPDEFGVRKNDSGRSVAIGATALDGLPKEVKFSYYTATPSAAKTAEVLTGVAAARDSVVQFLTSGALNDVVKEAATAAARAEVQRILGDGAAEKPAANTAATSTKQFTERPPAGTSCTFCGKTHKGDAAAWLTREKEHYRETFCSAICKQQWDKREGNNG